MDTAGQEAEKDGGLFHVYACASDPCTDSVARVLLARRSRGVEYRWLPYPTGQPVKLRYHLTRTLRLYDISNLRRCTFHRTSAL